MRLARSRGISPNIRGSRVSRGGRSSCIGFRPPLSPYPQDVFALGLAVAAFAAFLAGVAHDTRSFSIAVFLGLALALGALGGAERLAGAHDAAAHLLLLALVLLAVA